MNEQWELDEDPVKLLPAAPEPRGLLVAPKESEPDREDLIEFYKSVVATIDLAEELLGLFYMEFYS